MTDEEYRIRASQMYGCPMSEQWRDVAGYEGLYQVSDQGRVKNLARTTNGGFKRERVLRTDASGGYHRVTLSKDCLTKRRMVHHLVLEAFTGQRQAGQDGCHNDGDVDNNTTANLRWDTKRGNNADKVRHGTHQKGSNNPAAKLTEGCVTRVRDLLISGESQTAVAGHMGVSHRAIWQIHHKIKWAHVA